MFRAFSEKTIGYGGYGMSKWITMDNEPFVDETMNIRELAELNGFDEWMVHIPNSNLRRTLKTGRQKVTGSYYEVVPGAEYARIVRNSKTGLTCYVAQPSSASNCMCLMKWAKRKLLKAKSKRRDSGRYLVVISYSANIIMPGGAKDEKTK